MEATDKKNLRVFTRYGGQFGILTRMPVAEIEKELYAHDRDPEWVIIESLDHNDERVIARIRREDISVTMLGKYHPESKVAGVEIPGLPALKLR